MRGGRGGEGAGEGTRTFFMMPAFRLEKVM